VTREEELESSTIWEGFPNSEDKTSLASWKPEQNHQK
jgi:hypothetical protein